MNDIRPSYYKDKIYYFTGDLGYFEIAEPINWSEDEKEFKRSEKVHGVFTNLSNNLQFYKGDETKDGGYDYLKNTYDIYGINAQVLLVKKEIVGGLWIESYRGYLDFSTYSRESNLIELKFNESGLYEKIKARQSEDLEMNRSETMDGDALEQLSQNQVYLEGRDILIVTELNRRYSTSTLKVASGDNSVTFEEYSTTLKFDHSKGGKFEAIAVPLVMNPEISGNAQTVYDYNVKEDSSKYEGANDVSVMFYADADNAKEITLDIDIDGTVLSEYYLFSKKLRLDLVVYENGLNLDYKTHFPLLELENAQDGNIFAYKDQYKYDILEGESLALAVHSEALPYGSVSVKLTRADVRITDPTYFEPTYSPFILPYEALNRILHIITNKENTLKSNALGRIDLSYKEDGDSAYVGITNGFWVRGFGDRTVDSFEDLTTSFKDFIESFEAVRQLGYGIEKVGFEEKVVVEEIPYFYQNEITIKIDKPSSIKRSVASDYFYSSIELGYEKPSGDDLYDEAMGLDEYNVSNTYTTNISRVSNVFEKISPYRADSYGKEFARRKQKSSYSTTDTTYDSDVFLMDLQKPDDGGVNFTERKWEKDFEIPLNFSTFVTGVYSAENATNLRFSPLNLLLRWGFWIKGGLNKYKDTYIRYSSSDGNSKLTTQLKGSDKTYSENGNVLVDDLASSLFEPEFIEFEYPVDAVLLNKINGKSINVNGETIMNYYGLVEFTNEDGMKEYGFLMELKPNGNGDWKLLKANKKAVRFNTDNITNKTVHPTLSGYSVNIKK